MQPRRYAALAALLALIAVAAGAIGAHAFDVTGMAREARLVATGAQYQMWHALAILAYVALGGQRPLAPWLLLAGIALFSGSLYALALGAPTALAWVTPVGGLGFLAGWAAMAAELWSRR